MASRFKTVTISEEVMKLKEAAENLNARKSTINWVRVLEKWCDEYSLEKNLQMILPEQLDKVLERFTVVRMLYCTPMLYDNRTYSYSQYWTGTSLQWRLMRGNLFKCKYFLMYSPALASIAS